MTTLKELETEKKELKMKLSSIDIDFNTAKKMKIAIESQLSQLSQKIKSHKNKEVILSEHAILRYIERVKGIDIEALKSEILDSGTTLMIEKMKSGKFPCVSSPGNTLVVKNNVIVTIT